MAKDRFDSVSNNMFSNATGFPLYRSNTRKEEAVQLQNALNANYNESLVPDGKLGSKTEEAVKRAGFSVPVDEDEFNAILAGKKPSGISTMTETQLKALYNQQKASGKTKDDYATWLRKEQRLAKLKQIGTGLFQFSTEWLKAKQMGSQNPIGENQPDQQEKTFTGVPTIVWVIGGAVLLVIGIAVVGSIAKNRGARVLQGGFQPN